MTKKATKCSLTVRGGRVTLLKTDFEAIIACVYFALANLKDHGLRINMATGKTSVWETDFVHALKLAGVELDMTIDEIITLKYGTKSEKRDLKKEIEKRRAAKKEKSS